MNSTITYMDIAKPTFKYLDDFAEFRKSDEFKFYIFLKENRIIYSVFYSNYQSLLKSFHHHNNPIFDNLHLESKSNLRWKLQRQFIKDLSNYLSSIYWVVDFSRATSEEYLKLKPDILAQFKEDTKSKFANDLTHQFIQGLRNFINHKANLKVTSIKSSSVEKPEIERNIYISKDQLLNSSFDWTSKAKEFITNQEEKIFLINILKAHFEIFSYFQNNTYKSIIRVNNELTQSLIAKLEEFVQRARELNLIHILPFSDANIRYLKYIIK